MDTKTLKVKKLILIFSLFIGLFISSQLFAQNSESNNISDFRKEGYLIGFGAQLPTFTGADLNDRFGRLTQLGPSLLYKSANNWLTGIGYNVMFSNNLNEPIGGNLTNAQGQIVGTDGFVAEIIPQMTGYNLQFKTGKIISISDKNVDSGILLMAGIGFLQHKINLNNAYATTPQIDGEYAKGYDKLTNGVMLSQTISFFRLDKKGLFNYQIGVELGEGFTKNRRNFNFDTRSTEDKTRFDFMIGLKFCIYVPAYLSAKDEYYY